MGVVTNMNNKMQACIDAWTKCAVECEMFKDEHCQKCAQICRQCAEECRKMAAM